MNNFSGDSSCKALWRFESGALGADSKGTNTLTNTSVLEDTTNFAEGACAASFNASAFRALEIADSSLASGFPLKSGDTSKKGTWFFHFRPTSLNAYQDVVAKFDWNAGQRSLAVYINGSSLIVQWGAGSSYVEYTCGSLTNNKWYHCAIRFDGVAKTLYVKVYNKTDSYLLFESTFSPSFELGVFACEFAIGRVYPNTTNRFVGQIDEFVVFNRLLSYYEIDRVRQGTYSFISNDFSGDSSCKALWRFEPGALTVDSKGNNTLIAVNSSASGSDWQEGSGSAQLVYASHQFFKITDTLLDSGFPLKSGDAEQKATFALRIKLTTQGVARQLLTKGGYVAGNFSFWSCIHNQYNTLVIYWGYNSGATFYTYDTGIVIPTGAWVHIAIRLDGINKILNARVYRYDISQVYTYSASPINVLNLNANEFRIGGSQQSDTDYTLDGEIDECVVFSRMLTDAEIDSIRSGTYSFVNSTKVFPAKPSTRILQSQSGRRVFPKAGYIS